MKNIITIYFDGGSIGNPGKGYGSFQVSCQQFNRSKIRVKFGDFLTCNEAEYLALIDSLNYLNSIVEDKYNTKLDIFSDSELVVKQVEGKWKCKKVHLRRLLNMVLELLEEYDSYRISWNSRDVNVEKFGH